MSEPLRICTAGTGYFSQFHYNAWMRFQESGVAELAALYDRSEEAGAACAARYQVPQHFSSFEEMLDAIQPDLLDIITPPVTHETFVRAAVERGIAVICQKPFTPDLRTAEALVDQIEAAKARVFIHENFRFQPWYPKLKSLIEEGAIGEPYQLTFRLRPGDGQGEDAYLSRQPYFQQMPRFLVHETAIHLIDTIRFLFGEVTSVYADLKRLNPVIAGEDAGVILLDFENGRRALFDGNRLADHAARNRRLTMGEMLIEGSGGTLTLDGFANIRLRLFGEDRNKVVDYDWDDRDYAGDCVYSTMKAILAHLKEGAPAPNSAKDYLTNLRIEEAVYRSAAEGQKQQLQK